jgi:hypothetical protein
VSLVAAKKCIGRYYFAQKTDKTFLIKQFVNKIKEGILKVFFLSCRRRRLQDGEGKEISFKKIFQKSNSIEKRLKITQSRGQSYRIFQGSYCFGDK